MDASKRRNVIAGIKLAAQALKNESTNQQCPLSAESELVPTLDSPLTDDTWNAFAVSRAI